VLVTHDRYMLDRVSTIVLGLDGQGGADRFADYSQWDQWQQERARVAQGQIENTSAAKSEAPAVATSRKKLPYLEAREYATLEARIAMAEGALAEKQAAANDPVIAIHSDRLMQAHEEVEAAQREVDALFARWAELEEKLQ
jgi:ATP-binding cassette subfamily F protein uup